MKNKNIIKQVIRCMKCDFEGTEEDLVFGMEDEEDLESGFDGCPNCKTDEYLIDHTYTTKELILKTIERGKNEEC